MGYFNRDSNNRPGRDNRGGGRGFGGRPARNDGPREMFKTVCSNCGKECEVPFRPTTGKPVYCSDCFEKISPRNDARPERSGGFDRPQRPERNKQSLPFQGRSNFTDRPQAPRNDSNNIQLDSLNAKLDKIISLLEQKTSIPEVKKVVPSLVTSEEAKVVKTPKVKKIKATKLEK